MCVCGLDTQKFLSIRNASFTTWHQNPEDHNFSPFTVKDGRVSPQYNTINSHNVIIVQTTIE